MSDNPFEEDSDRTRFIRPTPGGVRPPPAAPFDPAPTRTAAAQPPEPAGPAIPIALEGEERIGLGLNPLVAAAVPLLGLLGRLGQTQREPNQVQLRERALAQIRTFERDAMDGGVPQDQVVKARYALCASLDDVAQNTEWGRDGVWASRPLIAHFREGLRGYEGIQAGVGFFRLMQDSQQRPATELPLLELMYLCLSLGFLGQIRAEVRPLAALDRVRQELYTLITRQEAAPDPALSPHWQGITVPYRPARAVVPTWVMGAAAAAVIGGLFVWFSTGLNAASDSVFERMLSAPLDHMPQLIRSAPVRPPPPPPPQATQPEPLYVFLKPEIDQGLVTVLGNQAMPIVRIRNRGLFASGSASVAPSYTRLLERIGEALKAEKGPVQVVGYTDNQPIHTVQFPSNFQLSTARAAAARAIIVRALGDPARVTDEGRADAEPIASNATPEGRDENRRIEVVLRRRG
jgi:type VI secretion system protein ImpK